MFTSERPAKRQCGSLSPASPQYHFTRPERTAPSPRNPQTPQSPVRMSSANHGSPSDKQQTFPTPPSTAGYHSNMTSSISGASDMSAQATTPTQNTPASLNRDGDLHMQDSVMDQGDTDMTDAPDHRRSDHERQTSMPRESKPHALQLLCQTLCLVAHPISRPHPSLNLISLYGLDAIASTVARRDAITGEKINKLRKSYEGKVKNLGLPGRNKPTDIPGELLGFMEWPDEGWFDQRVYGKELERAESGPVIAKLAKALQFNPGRLPTQEHEKWKNVLALEDGIAAKTPLLGPSKNAAQQAMMKSQPPSIRASAPASPHASSAYRPDRTGKKRRYDESSYAGYADGYQDDDGYSTGGMDDKRGSASKKRRKDFSPNYEGSGSGLNNNSSGGGGAGMLGVGVKSS
ncbi:hypothetical protein MBLNU459_g1366t1 [Dothideomycetes sp. NU459]